ncbi:unnamed protein product [Darwinula stevensoni]|uniref:Uncharacterized protein n=1 Tax=Darwinula stevensoni TaxID=69355 RepID=A0A7R9FQX0_9CRUS|nr:unnamed protein product [Darwinula stevensoni]CAG0900543.1 unnamed protein product [Darwinula stevensoni]
MLDPRRSDIGETGNIARAPAQALNTERRLKEHEIRINELQKQLGNETSKRQVAEQRNREIEKQPQVLQQKLSNASTEEKEGKDMLKMEKNAHEETKRKLSEIERKLKVAELQRQLAILKEEPAPVNARNKELASQTLMLSEDPIVLLVVQRIQMPDLLAFIKENKDKLIVIHVYSHARVKIVDVEKIKRRIVEKLSHAVSLDADLDDTEVMEFFRPKRSAVKPDRSDTIREEEAIEFGKRCHVLNNGGCLASPTF